MEENRENPKIKRKRKRNRKPKTKTVPYETPLDPLTGLAGSPPRRYIPPSSPQPSSSQPSSSSPARYRKSTHSRALKYLEILWDGENVTIPACDSEDLEECRKYIISALRNFKTKLRKMGYQIGKFRVFRVRFNDFFKKIFEECELTVHEVIPDVEYPKRDHVDVKIEDYLNVWAVSAPIGAHVMLIANDQDYIRVISRLQRCGFHLHLVSDSKAKCEAAAILHQPLLSWRDMLATTLNSSSDNPEKPEKPLRQLNISSENENEKLLVNVLWDLNTCPIPPGIKIEEIMDNIKKSLQDLNFGGVYKIEAFDKFDSTSNSCPTLNRATTEVSLTDIGFTCLLPPRKGVIAQKRDHVDVRIKKLMCVWAVTREPPSPILLISEDRRLGYTVKKICKQKFEILLAHTGSAPLSLKKNATRVVLLNDMLNGIGREEGKTKKKKRSYDGTKEKSKKKPRI